MELQTTFRPFMRTNESENWSASNEEESKEKNGMRGCNHFTWPTIPFMHGVWSIIDRWNDRLTIQGQKLFEEGEKVVYLRRWKSSHFLAAVSEKFDP